MVIASRAFKVGIIQLNNHKGFNLLTCDYINKLCKQIEEFNADGSLKVILLKGTDKSFSVGAKVDELRRLDEAEIEKTLQIFFEINAVSKPIVAAVKGHVVIY